MMSRSFLAAATIAAVALLSQPQCQAQVLYGSIVGNVTDPTRAAIAGATVVARNKGSNQTRTTTTNDIGGYTIATLPSGTYDLEVNHSGFSTFLSQNVMVANNIVTRVDVQLRLSAVVESTVVVASAATLQADRSEVRHLLQRRDLTDLPLPSGRNYAGLFLTLPGFTPPNATNSIAGNPSRSMPATANGVNRDTNNLRIDGTTYKSLWLQYLSTYVPSAESIEAVDVVTNSFDAEQGLAGGAAVNVQIKSGTNELHGSLYEFHTNNHLKARPFFLPSAQGKPKLVDNQFGATAGGPILRNRLFFFGSYEATRNHQNGGSYGTVPTPAMRTGDLSASPNPVYDPATGIANGSGRTPFPGNLIPENRIDPIVKKLIALTPLPSENRLTTNYFGSAPTSYRRTTMDGKVNWNASRNVTLFGRFGVFLYEMKDRALFDKVGGPPTNQKAGSVEANGNTYSTAVGGTYLFSPTLILDANFGWSRMVSNSIEPRLEEKLGLEFLKIPGTNGPRTMEGGWPQFTITDFTQLGSNSNKPFFWRDPSFTYVANVGWIKGRHNVRFGTDISRLQLNHLQAEFSGVSFPANGGFSFTGGPTTILGGKSPNQFNSFGAYLLGLPQRLGKIQVNDEILTIRNSQYSLYVRDQWSVSRRLSISWGVRYEFFPMPTRANRGVEWYDPTTNKVSVCGIGSVPTNCGISMSKKLFAPRLGLAFRATDTFVVRAGYGISYDPYSVGRFFRDNYPSDSILDVQGANSFLPAGRLADGLPVLPAPNLGNGIIDLPGQLGVTSLNRKYIRGYSESFNFTLQKELKWGFVGQAGYVGSRRIHNDGPLDVNVGQVGGGNASRPLYQRFGRTAITNVLQELPGVFRYDSLQTTLKHSFAGWYQVSVAYTWAKAMGNASDSNPNSNNYGRSVRIPLFDYYGLNRALAEFDRTHTFSITGIAELPFGKGKKWLARRGPLSELVGGWQLNGIFSSYSGQPFSVTASGTSLNAPGNTQRADQVKAEVRKLGGAGPGQAFYDPFAFIPVTAARFGTAGFNSLRAPGAVNLDLGLFREFRLTERWRAQFRAEAFNFMNTPHFDAPGSNHVSNVSNLQLNPDSTIRSLGGYMELTNVTGAGREGIDERQFRFALRFTF